MVWNRNSGFKGTLGELVENLFDRFCPRAEVLVVYQSWLLRELALRKGPFPCRHFGSALSDYSIRITPKVNFFEESLPFGIIASDNECTSSLYAAARAGLDLSKLSMLDSLRSRVLRIGILDSKTSAQSRARLSELGIKAGPNAHPLRVSLEKLKLCHLADAADDFGRCTFANLEDELATRIFRSLNPFNVFPFPNKDHFHHVIDGRRETDFGESARFKRFVCSYLHFRLGRDHSAALAAWLGHSQLDFNASESEKILKAERDTPVEMNPGEVTVSQPVRTLAAPPRELPSPNSELPKVLVSGRLIDVLATRVAEDPVTAQGRKYCLKTSSPGWRFEVEYPTAGKIEALVSALTGDLVVHNRGPTGRNRPSQPQFRTQFGGCYLVATDAWQSGANYIE